MRHWHVNLSGTPLLEREYAHLLPIVMPRHHFTIGLSENAQLMTSRELELSRQAM